VRKGRREEEKAKSKEPHRWPIKSDGWLACDRLAAACGEVSEPTRVRAAFDEGDHLGGGHTPHVGAQQAAHALPSGDDHKMGTCRWLFGWLSLTVIGLQPLEEGRRTAEEPDDPKDATYLLNTL